MNITFVYDGYASQSGTPDHLVPRLDAIDPCGAAHGLSGTEIPLLGTAKELSRRGHVVNVYSKVVRPITNFWIDEEGKATGAIHYHDLGAELVPADVVLAWHDARPLARWPDSCLKIAHHQSYGVSPQEDAHDFAHFYLTATDRVAVYHRERRGWDIGVLPNAWDFGSFKPWNPTPGRLIFTTSVERGFHRLLEALPLIRKLVPEAHAIVYSRGGPAVPGLRSGEGVEVRPCSSRNDVLEALSTASCFAYPCDVPSACEVWPMSVTDALATGVPVVLAPDDGIEGVFQGGVTLTPSIKEHPDGWLNPFVEQVVRTLTDPAVALERSRAGLAWAAPFTFKRSVDLLLTHIARMRDARSRR